MQGEVVERVFKIVNVGDAELEISDIKADCGCTVVEPERKILAPTEESKIKVTFNSAGFVGRKTKSVRVYTNDPYKRSVSLTLTGEVQQEIDTKPRRVFFDTISRGSDLKKTVKINLNSNSDIEVLDIVSKEEAILVEKVSDLEFNISLSEEVPFGIFRGHVAIRTNSKRNPVLNVPVFAKVQGDLFFKPADLSFGLLQGPLKKTVSKTVRLYNNTNSSFNIIGSRSEEKHLAVSLKESKLSANSSLEVEVQLLEGLYGTLHSKVVLISDHTDAEQKEIELPVYGIISKKGD